MNDYAKQVLYRFSIMCGHLLIDEHIALENLNVRKQLSVEEPLEDKLKNLQNILENEF